MHCLSTITFNSDIICRIIVNDIIVTNEDVYTLKTDWLTDNIIAFWEEYLEREYLVHYPSANIVLLRPSMSFMLLQTPDPLTLREALPNFTKTTHIFLPINDCRNVNEAEGGTHWSLLLVSVVDGIAFHYDSLPPGNREEALQATLKLATLLDKKLRFIVLEDSPMQENSSDCGVFVCLHMRELLLRRLLRASSSEKISMSMGGLKVNANSGRKEMVRIIERFRKQGGRGRRSSYVVPTSFLSSACVCALLLISVLLPVVPLLLYPDSALSARAVAWEQEMVARYSSLLPATTTATATLSHYAHLIQEFTRPYTEAWRINGLI
ncbi:hypothetical protein AJ79_06803 [Helicocarpus griseus UAMH5409]|uniref:Ubiquitin-like protease family profile domain-containing protein n=1 Tax=Helicocarpus griseus UAMH5409 TaxID=1447875 RepID=A0A2B7X8V1_9EURO|nr:hypothetical protein AJ79_06803 [Helicocarpus griseus UAMH5409]